MARQDNEAIPDRENSPAERQGEERIHSGSDEEIRDIADGDEDEFADTDDSEEDEGEDEGSE